MKLHKKSDIDSIGTKCSECGQDSDVLIEIGYEEEIAYLCPACIKRAFGFTEKFTEQPKSMKELTSSERGEIIWLSNCGYSPENIARELNLPLHIITAYLRERVDNANQFRGKPI